MLTSFGSIMLLFMIFLFNIFTSAFSGDFELTYFDIESPFQADPTSITNTTLSFEFHDQNTPKDKTVFCVVTWAVGLDPPPRRVIGSCSDNDVNVWFPSGTYKGVEDFQLQITHTYQDDSVGEPPYNYNTLHGFLNLTHGEAGETAGYTCDMEYAVCQSEPGAILIAKVLYAFAK